MNNINKIEKLGMSSWVREMSDESLLKEFQLARVITVNKNSYIVSDGISDIYAEVTGKFLYNSDSPLEFPTVGDWVYVQLLDENTFAIIHQIIPRKTTLKRKSPGKTIDYQLIAANIDTAIIMQSLDSNFNMRRLERYLVIANESGITPLIFLSKSDLLSAEEIAKIKEEISKILPDIHVITFSNKELEDIEKIKSLLIPMHTYCLLGSSGVGKTTLINNLTDCEMYKTQPIREKDGKGRHTTTKRELVKISNGAIIIDSPGMRELGVISSESGIEDTFKEIMELADQCRFKDCTHTIEKGCAVLKAIDNGNISKERFDNYMKMQKESRFYEMSYHEKRQKDKQFGKQIHHYFKEKRDKRL